MHGTGGGRVVQACSCPPIRTRIVSGACIQIVIVAIVKIPSPNDHGIPAPHGRVRVSADGCVNGVGRHPTVIDRIVLASGVPVMIVTVVRIAAPDYHFTAVPHRCV